MDTPQSRFEHDRALDPVIDTPGREGLTGTAPGNAYDRARDPEEITIAPDGRPMDEQPQWRRDFAIDWPEDHYVARRDFAKFLVLTSLAFAVGQGWIAAQELIGRRKPRPARVRIASLRELPHGSAQTFRFPTVHDPCLLIRMEDGALVAYSQKCTHLSCAVIPKIAEGMLECPCHEGYFDLKTGQNIAGPPPRPLPKIRIEVVGDDIYATGMDMRTV